MGVTLEPFDTVTRIDRYILRLMVLPVALSALVTVVVTVGVGVQEQIKILIQQVPIVQLQMGDILTISGLLAPTLAGYILPVSLMLGIMMAYSGMATRNELTALKASGVSMKRAVFPAIAAGSVLSVCTFGVQDYVQPMAFRALSQLVTSDLPLRVTIDMLSPGAMHTYGDWRVYIGSRDEDGVLHDLTVLQSRDNGEADAFYAARAHVERDTSGGSRLVLKDCYLVPADMETKIYSSSLSRRIPALEPRNPLNPRYARRLSELMTSERAIAAAARELPSEQNLSDLRKERIELSERLAFPLMCLAVSLVSAPLAARARGRASTFAAGLFVICAYFTLRKMAEPSWVPGREEAIALAQIPNVALLVTGAVLVWRVDRV